MIKGSKELKSNIFVRILGNEKYQPISIPIFSILCGLITISIVVLILGKNPFTVFFSLLQGAGILPKSAYAANSGMLSDFASTLSDMTPLMFAAMSVAVAFKAGLFNIGVSGQMLAAGFIATITIGYSNINGFIAKPLVIIIGVLVGAILGGFLGYLKYRFNINEVVSSIMCNYIFMYIISFFILTRFVDPVSRQSKSINETARLVITSVTLGNLKIDLPVCIILALLIFIFIYILYEKTTLGYEFKSVGLNIKASKYAGINVSRRIVLAMVISGALAGLAGVTYYLGYYNSIQPRTLADVGFNGIAVSLLGNNNPVGIIFSSFLITFIDKGRTYMSSTTGLANEITSLITALILLFCACGNYIKYVVNKRNRLGGQEDV